MKNKHWAGKAASREERTQIILEQWGQKAQTQTKGCFGSRLFKRMKKRSMLLELLILIQGAI